MCRMDIDALQYTRPGDGRPINLKVGRTFFMDSRIIKSIDYSEETNVCRVFMDDGSIFILAKVEFLFLQVKSIQKIGEKNNPPT